MADGVGISPRNAHNKGNRGENHAEEIRHAELVEMQSDCLTMHSKVGQLVPDEADQCIQQSDQCDERNEHGHDVQADAQSFGCTMGGGMIMLALDFFTSI